jgi:hypothetical protein
LTIPYSFSTLHLTRVCAHQQYGLAALHSPPNTPDTARWRWSPSQGPQSSSPEARLWTTVILDALESLETAGRWCFDTYPKRLRELLQNRAGMKTKSFREQQQSLEQQQREMTTELDSCMSFFFSERSRLEFICSALGYELGSIRRRARSVLINLRARAVEPSSTRQTVRVE